MLSDFLIQVLFSLIFFLGLTGVGFFLTKFFKFKTNNLFLSSALAFFTSLCLYIILAVPVLIYFPSKLMALSIFSVIYFLISFLILGYFYNNISLNQVKFFFKKNWLVLLAGFFVLGIFFLQIYKTALFDEWLHRPVVNHFVNRGGEFPFVNPYSKDQNFNGAYHYGLYIPTATIQIFTKLETPEALDILKLSYAIASFFLIYGIAFEFSKNNIYSIAIGIFLLFSGGLFFVTDMFMTENFDFWDTVISFFNPPVLFLLAGITWVNITLSLAFIWLMEQVFYKKAQFNVSQILLFIVLLGGFYLISELFVALILILFSFSIFINLIKKKIDFKKIILILGILLAGLLGIIFSTGGVASGLIGENKTIDIGSVLSFRPFGQWGYPNSSSILGKSEWAVYLKSYSLAGLVGILFICFLFFKKSRTEFLKTFNKFPLIWLSFFICLLVPFFFSTIYGDINLAKIRELWPVLIYLILFYLIYKLNYKKIILIPVIILFLASSFPIVIVNYAIQWKENERYDKSRCRENNLCYPQEEINVLRKFEKENPDKNKVVFVKGKEEMKIIDETNSISLPFYGKELFRDFFEDKKVDFVFYSKEMKESLKKGSKQVIWDNFEGYIAEGDTAILRRKK